MMDWDDVERTWEQTKGKLQEKWGKLTDDDVDLISGLRDRLEAKIQQRYGFATDHARKEVEDWVRWQVPVSPQVRSRAGKSFLVLVTMSAAARKPQISSPTGWARCQAAELRCDNFARRGTHTTRVW
jgi:uncharacterized protein YjbJ (UPF0337 family)